jgi:hypothetical protein
MGVFGDFKVSVSSKILTSDDNNYLTKRSVINKTTGNSFINVGGGVIGGAKVMERTSMMSIKENGIALSQDKSSPRLRIETSPEKHMQDTRLASEMRKANVTTTNRSRAANYSSVFNKQEPKISGEADASHASFSNRKFVTQDERKHGKIDSLKQIERSITKLHAHSIKNWSIQDIKQSIYNSPSNFKKSYL